MVQGSKTPRRQFRILTLVMVCMAAFAAVGAAFHRLAYNDYMAMARRQAQSVECDREYGKAPVLDTNAAKPCPLVGTSKIPTESYLIIDKPSIRTQSQERLDFLKQFTRVDYEQFLMAEPGKEHYTLWHWLTKTYHPNDDCQHVVDIGTRFAASALALGAAGAHVKTFDTASSGERIQAFRGKTEEEWQAHLNLNQTAPVKIQFHNLDLLTISDAQFQDYMSTWLIVLDTAHLPFTYPFERQFLARLIAMEPKFEGILMLDDIHLNKEMVQWWKELLDNAGNWGFTAYDLTSVGHATGTGLLDFSGRVAVKE